MSNTYPEISEVYGYPPRWLNRRGGKRRVTWDRLVQLLEIAGFPKKRKTVSMF